MCKIEEFNEYSINSGDKLGLIVKSAPIETAISYIFGVKTLPAPNVIFGCLKDTASNISYASSVLSVISIISAPGRTSF